MGVRVATKPLRLFGVEGLLAHANIAGGIPRLAVSVAAVAVSLSMLVALAIMIGSFRETVIYWVGQTLRADLYVSMPRRSTLGVPATFSPELEKLIAAHPAVEAVEGFRSTSFLYRGRAVMLAAGDFRAMSRRGQLLFKEPRDARSVLRPLEGDSVLVSEPFALREGLSSGDELWLETPRGRSRFRVAAVYYDYSTDRGVILMDRPTFGRFFGDHRPTNLAVYLHAGIDASEVQPELVRQLGDRHPVFIRTNAALRQQALRIFDNTFSVTYALEAIAMLVGMLGIAGTLATLIVDRRRDLTMLSLLGAARRQIRRMVLIEAGFIGVVSQVLALGGGLSLALLLVYVINVQSFGWTIQFDVPFNFLAQSAGVLLLAALLAGLYPARVAARAHGSIREDE
jgi:putative ABC transport system permease protein